MHSRSVHMRSDGCLRREDSDMTISSLDDCFSTRDGHTEDVSTDEYLLLEPPEGMDTGSITRENNDIRTTIEEFLHSLVCQISNCFSCFIPVWGIFSIHLEDHLDIWKLLLKDSHNHLSSES